ncbi:MAG: hypothetical protein U1F33_09390 [Alphaproteobacteria bacterium]
MRLLTLIVGLVLALAAVAFAVANRAPVTLELWPLPSTYDMPIFALAFCALGAGFILGMAFMAIISRPRRRRGGQAANPPNPTGQIR